MHINTLYSLYNTLPEFASVNQKKRAKAYQEMQERLRAGDKVQTIGGIVGRISRIKEANGIKTVLIETGDKTNKAVIEFDINAIAGVVEGLNNPEPAKGEEVEEEFAPKEKTTKTKTSKSKKVDASADNKESKKEAEPAKKTTN